MSGQEKAPWEQGDDNTPPWESAAAPGGESPNELTPSIMNPIKEEMHPGFSTFERTIIKNLSNDPEASVKYLKERHPELEIKHSGGRILARGQGEQEYRVLDPETGFHPGSMEGLKEAGRDILDSGYDLASGVGQGLASTAGGTAGALATLPAGGAGAVPAAMAASGAAGAGLEAARQGLGKLAGIPQDMNWGEVGANGALSAVMPAGMGAGLTKGAVESAAKGAGKELTEDALKQVLKSGRGAIGRAWDFNFGKALPVYGEMAGGIPRQTTQTLRDNLPKIQEMENAGVTDSVEAVHNRIVGGLASAKQATGQELERAITESGKLVDSAKIKAPLQQAIEQAKKDATQLNNKGMTTRVEELQQIYDDLFSNSSKEGKSRVLGLAEGMPGVSKSKEIPDQISAKAAFNLQEQLADLADLYKTGQGPQARFGAGATRSEKKTSEVMRQAYNAVNDGLDQATEGLSPQLKARYREFSMIQKDLQPFFRTPEKTFDTLSTLGKKDRKMLFEKLSNLETEHGIPLMQDARTLEAFREYSKPALMGKSGLGTTSTSRTVPLSVLGGTLGSLAGYKLGGGYAGAAVGGMAGAKAGAYLGSPDYIRRIIQLERGVANQAQQRAKPVGVPTLFGAGRSAWQALQGDDE